MTKRLHSLGRFIRWCCVPVFLLTLAMAIRTLDIGTNDNFFFGRGERWHCQTVISVFQVSARLDIYEPGYPPFVAFGSGPFFRHVVAKGVTWTVSGGTTRPTYTTRDWGVAGVLRGTVAGHLIDRAYWLYLPLFPLAALFLSAAILIHWAVQIRASRRAARRGLCPVCRYDLRAHKPGDKCPECGTVIPAALADAPESGGPPRP